MSKLTAKRVRGIMGDCLLAENEIEGLATDDPRRVRVRGIMHTYVMHQDRLEKARPEVLDPLRELPDEAKEGTSFLNLFQDRHGHHWGEHPDMEALCALGIALGAAKFPFQRAMWASLPGGMPYVLVTVA